MDGRGGCCIASYAGGAYDMSKVDRIMLRFRPIAPKPATGGSKPEKKNDVNVKTGRGKRKNGRDKTNNSSSGSSGGSNNGNNKKGNKKQRRPNSLEKRDGNLSGKVVVTLPLLPEKPERKDSPAPKPSPNAPIWINFKNDNSVDCEDDNIVVINNNQPYRYCCVSDRTVVMPQAVKMVGSWVTVECVTDTWVDGDGLGCTDQERRRNLEWDTCPGFISDGLNRVTWTNGVYSRMVAGGEIGGEGGEKVVSVWLVMKERVPVTYPAFTCRVRLQYTCTKEKNSIITLPCDVWRMDGGGFAWRLDVKAALCLGR